MADNSADGQILLSLKMAETLALIQSQLNQISKNLDLQITGKLNKTTTKAQLKSDLESMKSSQKINLTGKLDKSKTKAQLKSDIASLSRQPLQLQAKINTADLQRQIQKANIQLDTSVDGNEELKEVGNSLDTINKKSAATVASIMTLREAFTYLQRAAKQMIETAANLDKQLTDLRMATGENYEEISRLVNDYTQLAKSLGATSSQITEIADNWLRQGKSISETNTLIADSWKLSAISELDAATSTEYLTSVMKAYKYAVDEVIGIVDKVSSVDLVSATNAGGLMEAMNRTATTANMAGVSIDKLLGYTAAMGEVTGRSMSSVGESLKTIFSRMSDIKANKLELIDEDGTTELLSDVELTLKNVDIDLRETVNEYNNYEDVLDDLASKWNTLSEVQQNALTKAFAGTRQQDMFRILMENYDTALKYAETSMNSAGTATEKFNAYLESVQAHYNSLVASAEALAKQTVPTNLMNGLMDAASAVLDFLTATNLLTIALSSLTAALSVKGLAVFGSKIKNIYQSVSKLSTAFNLLDKAAKVDLSADEFNSLLAATKGLNAQQLKLIVSSKNLTNEQRMQILMASGLTKEQAAQTLATMGLATAEGTATAATFSLSGAFKTLTAAIAANPIGFLVVALTTAVSVISTFSNKMAEARQETIEAGNAAAEEGQELLDLVASYLELADAVDAGTASKEDMIAAQDDVINALGLEGKSVDELIAKYGNLKNAIIAATQEKLETDISLAVSGANAATKDAVSELETWLGTSISSGTDADIFQYLKDQGFSGIGVGTKGGTISLPNLDIWDAFSNPTFEELAENRKYLEAAMNAVREEFGSDSAVFEQLSEAYTRYSDAIDPAIEAIDNSNTLIAEYWKMAESAINDPKTQEEFDAFRQGIIDKLSGDNDWNDDGTYTAAGLVDSLLSTDRAYAQFYDDLVDTTNDGLDAVEDAIQSHGDSVKGKLEALWNAESFSDTKKSIEEMASSLDGITADNIDSLIEGSAELAALLEEDGMNAQFLANILQTEVMSGNGFDLITEDALKLNSALEGMKGRFDEVTDAKSRYDAALAGGEKDDNFKNYAEALEALNEEFVKGYENSNQFWAAAEYLFGTEQLNEWGWSQGLDEIYAAMERNVAIFGDAESAGTGFLDRLYEISEAGQITADDGSVIAQIEKLSDGTYDFQFDSTNLDALAERLGITSEAATACMQALSMYGDFQFYDIETVMSTIEEIGLASDSINGTAVNVGTLTDQLIALGYNNKDIHDLMLVLQEVDGVSLLDVNANVDTLTQSLSDLGLAAQDGVTVTVNADGLADLMSQLNFTKEDTQNLITKLGEADGITLTNAEGEVISLNDALEYTDELTFASVTSEIDGITSSAELAEQAVEDLQYSINTLKGKTVTVTLDVQRKSGILGSIFGYAKGTDGAPEGDALVGEEGEELVQSGNRAYFVGTNGPEITHLNEGDIVYTAAETRKIKRGATVIRGIVPAFAGGTGLGKSNKTYESVLPSTSTSKSTSTSSSSSSSTSNAESEFERLYKYHQHLLNMDQESVADYIAWLDKAYQQAYKNGEIELDDYYKYQEEVFDKIKESLDDLQKAHENAITFDKIKLDNAIEAGDYGDIVKYTDDIVEHYKAMQNEVHLQAEYYRSIGYVETSDEITKLKSLWWDYYEEIKNVSADAWQQVVDNANDALDGVTGLYDTLKGAAQEYAENGYITVDTLQSIYKLGVQNLAYLQDENGQLVINEANIQKVIAARTQQMAIETALNYIQQLRTALTNQDTAALQNLIFATDVAANSTWDLVYAQLQLLGLDESQYNAALQRINTLRYLADVAVTSIGRVDNAAKEALESTSQALDDILEYVKDMIKQEVENQVEALEDQIDRYREIVDLQKKSLDLEREKDNYTKSVAEKTKAIAELQARIARLDLDDSREAQAEKAKLMEELADLNNDLAETQADHAYEVNSDALDAMADAYEKEKNKEIEVLENTISSEEKLYQLAIQRINNEWDTLYSDLCDWAYNYGNVTINTLTEAWNAASQAVQQYGSYLNAVAATQSQLSAIDSSSSTAIGSMGSYDTSGGQTMSRVKEIVAQMKANSKQHGNEDADGKLRLNKENLRLGEELQKLIGRTVVRGNDGVWYLDKVGGAQLYSTYPYSTYHTGGIVGDDATPKQDEMFALLKKREAVFTEPQQEVVYRVLKADETIAGKLGISGGLYHSMNGSGYAEMQSHNAVMRDMQQAQAASGGNHVSQSIGDVTVPVHVMVTEKLDKSDIRRLSKEISSVAAEGISEAFIKRGKGTLRDSLLKP